MPVHHLPLTARNLPEILCVIAGWKGSLVPRSRTCTTMVFIGVHLGILEDYNP